MSLIPLDRTCTGCGGYFGGAVPLPPSMACRCPGPDLTPPEDPEEHSLLTIGATRAQHQEIRRRYFERGHA